jgi:hypothetical protein
MTSRRALVLLAAANLAGCLFDFQNPAEVLDAGQIGGTVLADVAGSGAPVARENVAVSLKGAAFDQATRPNGRFVLLDLPVGRHRLLFRTGTTWALERDVDLAWGSDGQPEGIELGEVVLRYSAAVQGTVSLPVGNTIASGVAVDESSGLTAPLVLVTPAPGDPAPPVTFRFPMLALGTHLIKLQAVDTLSGKWVGGQVVVGITEADQGTTISLANVAARAASATGRLRFQVQAIGLALSPTQVQVFLTPNPGLNPITPASDGSVDVTVPEGLYAIELVPPATAPPLPRPEPGAAPPLASSMPLAAAAPVPTVSPPLVYGVVLQGRVAEVGSVYVASDSSILASLTSCAAAEDCGGLTCSAGSCVGYVPVVPPVTAATTFCAACLYDGLDSQTALPPTCQAGPGVPGVCHCPGPAAGIDCAARGPLAQPAPSYCEPQACGFACTPDGASLSTYKPATAPCP